MSHYFRDTKKLAAFLFSFALLFISSFAFFPQLSAEAVDVRLRYGWYYRIKNAATGYYLTVSNTSSTVGTVCILAARSGSQAQQFQFSPGSVSGTYRLKPRSASTLGIGVSSAAAANSTGNPISLQSPASLINLTITPTSNGYKISPAASTAGLVFGQTASSLGSTIITKNYTGNYNWIFEPVYNGEMRYFATTPLGTDDSAVADNIVANFTNIGYTSSRINLPTASNIYIESGYSRAMVFHGHGGAGYIRLDSSDGTNTYMYSENASVTLNGVNAMIWSGQSFVYFASCQSAASTSTRRSMVEIPYELGANCVIGFQNDVSGAEDFLDHMIECIYDRDDLTPVTIQMAIDYAISQYSDSQKEEDSCPANTDNLVIHGNTNICIDKRLI